MLIELTNSEFDLIISALSSDRERGTNSIMHFDTSDYDDLLMELYEYENGFTSVPFVYVIDIEYDNSAVTENRRVVCKAFDEEDAYEIVKNAFNKTSFDTISIKGIRKFNENDIIFEKIIE